LGTVPDLASGRFRTRAADAKLREFGLKRISMDAEHFSGIRPVSAGAVHGALDHALFQYLD